MATSFADIIAPLRESAAQRQAEEQAAKELKQQQETELRERRRKEAELAQRLDRFIEGFFYAVKKDTPVNLRVGAYDEITRYVNWLVAQDGSPEPGLFDRMKEVARSKFMFGIALNAGQIPEGHFNGQRTDWCADGMNDAREKAEKYRSR